MPSRVAEQEACRLVLVGFGAVNTTLLRIALQKQDRLAPLGLVVVGVADSRGCCWRASGLELQPLLDHKLAGHSVASFAECGQSISAEAMLDALGGDGYDVLVEGSLMELEGGGVGLACARRALQDGCGAVLANKGPLVCAFDELLELAGTDGRLFYSATVCGGLPVVNVIRRDVAFASNFTSINGVFNSTSNYVLAEMGKGRPFEQAVKTAQELGIAEADWSKDIDG